MSIGSRIKELRENRNISRNDFATMIGVTVGAVSNYENDVSSPKEPILFKIIETLECEPNYIFQDMVKIKSQNNDVTIAEYDYIKKYRDLDPHGKKMVDFTLNEEWERSIAEDKNRNKAVTIFPNDNMNYVNAAHADDYSNAPNKLKQQEEDIMDEENF